MVFLQELREHLKGTGIKFLLAGPPIAGYTSWKDCGNDPYIVDETRVYSDGLLDLLNSAKILLVMNRKTGFKPQTPCRGFVEASSGSMVLMDNLRPAINRYFDTKSEMGIFFDAKECAEMIVYYLNHPDEREAVARAGFERSKAYSYQKRFRSVLQCVQASRETFL